MDDYLLKVGTEGAVRLDLVNDILGPHSRRFLLDAGLRPAGSVLEIGCGTGNLTRFLARTVGREGRVVAVDASPQQLDLAQRRCVDDGIDNVTFVLARVEDLDLPARSFDLACCRLLLMHLRTPDQAVASVVRLLAPGGTLACEEPTASSLLTVPRMDVFHRVNDAFIRLGAAFGLDFDVGDRLFEILTRSGLAPTVARFVQPILPVGVAKNLVLGGIREGLTAARRAGIVTEEDAVAIVADLERLPEAKSAFYAVPRVAQVAAMVA